MTSWFGFSAARARASAGLLLTLLALVTVTTAIIAGTVGYSQAAATTAARGALSTGLPTEIGVQVQTRLAEDPGQQDTLAREAIADAFAPASVDIARMVVTEPRPVQRDGQALEGRVVLLGGPDLEGAGDDRLTELVSVVEGTWPEGGGAASRTTGADADGTPDDASGAGASDADQPAPGALHVGAASAWEVSVGDVLVVDDRAVEVVATWQPVDPQAAYWFGDDLVRTGQVEADHGPLVVAEGLARQVGTPFVRWSVSPDASAISPDDLSVLATGAEDLRSILREAEGVGVRGVTAEGDLAPTAATAATNLATANALGVVPLSVLVLVTGLAVVQLARLLTSTREPQVQLLVARGAARRQVLLTGLVEAAVVALLGAVLGAAIAWGVLLQVPGGELAGRTVITVAAVALAGVLVVLAAVAALQTGRLTGGQAIADRSGRARAATALATLVLVLAAAGLAWWQLDRAGSPLVRRPDGTLGTDLVAGAAPALLLAAAAVVAAALLGPLSRAVELVTRPTRTAAGHLASAQVSRHLSVYVVPVVLTVLAVGATTLAALYAGTSAQLRDDLADVTEGAPLRADLGRRVAIAEPGLVPPLPPDASALPQIDRSTLVWLDDSARVGDLPVPVTMADTTVLGEVAHTVAAGTSLVPAGLDQLRSEDGTQAVATEGAIEIPPGAGTVEATVEITRAVSPWGMAYLASLLQNERDYRTELEEAGIDTDLATGGMDTLGTTPEEVVTGMLLNEAELLARPVPTEVSLLLRDTATGISNQVTAAEVTSPGMELTFDEEDLTDVTTSTSTSTETVTFTLPADRAMTIEAVEIVPPGQRHNSTMMTFGALDWHLDLEVGLTLTADGAELLGGTEVAWGSSVAQTPQQAEEHLAERAEAAREPFLRHEVEVHSEGSWSSYEESNEVSGPPVLDTSGTTWVLSGVSRELDRQMLGSVVLSPGATYVDQPRGGVFPGGQGAAPDQEDEEAALPGLRVPVALTPEAAAAAQLQVGDLFDLTFVGFRAPAVLTDLVPAVPGRTEPQAALVDSRSLAGALIRNQATLPWPAQVWATPSGDAQDAVLALRDQPDLGAVTGPGTVTITDATSAARLVFWVASAGAVLLALTGIGAVAATLLSARRPEVAVLRALGMPPRAQARSRALELVGVVTAAVLLGLAAGWLVSAAVVPELAASTTQPGRVQLPAVLRLEGAPWAALVGAGGLVLLLLTMALAHRVRGQALDNLYREEVR